MNHLIWVLRIALGTAASLTLLAQTTPAEYSVKEDSAPVEVKEALRARATEFFDYHVGPANRRAIDLVAEDTKDYYFAVGKMEVTKFNITNVEYDKDWTKAMVTLDVTRPWTFTAIFNVSQRRPSSSTTLRASAAGA